MPLETVILLTLAVIGVVAVTVVAGIPIVLVLMERKVSAYFQNRLGPTRVGPWGLLVTLADGIKLIFKEDMVPPSSDKKLFRLAPYVVFASSFAVVAVIPPFQSTVIGNMDLGLFLYLAISSLIVLGIIMAGWASNSKYSLFGALRAAAQIVSYEIPLGLAVLMIVMTTGTLNMQHLVMDQADGIHAWYMFRHPFLFIGAFIYFISRSGEGAATCSRKKTSFRNSRSGPFRWTPTSHPSSRSITTSEHARVGRRTDYDKLNLQVWTDGSLRPEDAMAQAARILIEHLNLIANFQTEPVPDLEREVDDQVRHIAKLLAMPVDDLELSVHRLTVSGRRGSRIFENSFPAAKRKCSSFALRAQVAERTG